MPDIRIARTDDEIAACFDVMNQLRPNLERSRFVAQVRSMERDGYSLAFLAQAGTVRAVAGYRIHGMLVAGRVLYVDDLVTDARVRSHGHGAALFAWLVAQAREHACDTLELDSGVQRFDAHRFYLRQRMDITSHHFRLKLDAC